MYRAPGERYLFNELTKLFSGERKERRHSPRKKVSLCNVAWVKGPGKSSSRRMGMEISLNGCLFATKNAAGGAPIST